MKKFSYLFCAVGVALLLGSCSSDGTSALDPSDAASQFNNPTGTLSSTNASDIVGSGVQSGTVGETQGALQDLLLVQSVVGQKIGKKLPGFRFQTTVADCSSGNAENGTIDFGCLTTLGWFELEEETQGCTGSGTISFTLSDTLVTVGFNNFSFVCPGSSVSACSGALALDLEGYITCMNLECSFDGETDSFNGCIDALNQLVLIIYEDESYVFGNYGATEGCASAYMTVTDSTGPNCVECAVTQAGANCPTPDPFDIEAFGSCTITPNATMCPAN